MFELIKLEEPLHLLQLQASKIRIEFAWELNIKMITYSDDDKCMCSIDTKNQ